MSENTGGILYSVFGGFFCSKSLKFILYFTLTGLLSLDQPNVKYTNH